MTPIDVSELLENPGTDRVVHLDEPIEGLALEMASVGAPLDAGGNDSDHHRQRYCRETLQGLDIGPIQFLV